MPYWRNGKMNTKKRLSDDIENTKEVNLEERFVALYEEEIKKLEEQQEDLDKAAGLREEEAKEFEEAARLYHRVFARNFYDAACGRISEEEFLSVWVREEELMSEIQSINSLEGEKKQLLKEIDLAGKEEKEAYGKVQKAEEIRYNRQAVFRSFIAMVPAALLLAVILILKFEFPAAEYVWQIASIIFASLFFLTVLYHRQKKAADKAKLYRMMANHKYNARCRLESDYQSIGNDLKFYYEKFDTVFGYISEEQWKLFEFCAKVSAGLKFCGELWKQGDVLKELMQTYHLKQPDVWLCHPKALYEPSKRKSYRAWICSQQDVCRRALERHQREIGGENYQE